MQNLIFSLNATLPVFLVMVVGYALGQLGFLPPAFCKASDRLTFKVTLPLMLFLDMGSVDILHDFRPRFVLFCFAATLVGILTVWAGAKRFLKDKALVGEFVQAGYRSSAAVLGVAFIQNIYGSAGMAPLMILGSVPLFNIFAVLILMLESPEQRGVPDPKQLLRGVATNPILLGIVFGTVYALLPFTLPQIATKTISSIASLTTPLSLLSIGASFEGTKAIKKLGPTLAAAFIKTVGLAAVFLPCAVALGFRNEELVALLIMLGSPTTPSAYVMSRNMGHEGVLTSSCIALTTLLSALTLTGWIFVLRSGGILITEKGFPYRGKLSAKRTDEGRIAGNIPFTGNSASFALIRPRFARPPSPRWGRLFVYYCFSSSSATGTPRCSTGVEKTICVRVRPNCCRWLMN